MGLFSIFKKQPAVAPIIPSLEEQQNAAKTYVDKYISEIYDGFDKEEDGDLECARFKIAGITNYCTRKDVGLIKGVSFSHNNPYDKTAVALGRITNGEVNSIYGYIAKVDKRAYKKIAGDSSQVPFFGYIKEFRSDSGQNGIMGVVKFYKGGGAKMYQQMIRDVQLLSGVFKGYYGEQTLEEQGEKLEWLLERIF